MDSCVLETIRQLLENYDQILQDRAITYADMMSDWAETSQSETVKYATKYQQVRIERQRLNDVLWQINHELDEAGTLRTTHDTPNNK